MQLGLINPRMSKYWTKENKLCYFLSWEKNVGPDRAIHFCQEDWLWKYWAVEKHLEYLVLGDRFYWDG